LENGWSAHSACNCLTKKKDIGVRKVAVILDQIRLLVENIIVALGYPGIALVMLIENLFPPIPSEVVMPFAGFLVADGRMSFTGIILAGTVGAGVGAIILYYLGMNVSEQWLRRIFHQYGKYLLLSEKDLDTAMNSFDRYGELYVLFGRVIPGVRSIISIPAGYKRMKFGKFIVFTLIGTIIWNILLGSAGVVLGQNWEQILNVIAAYETIIYFILAVLVFGFAVHRLWKVTKEEENDQV
jgi:membrane protein DedA with SNARE-associated domain